MQDIDRVDLPGGLERLGTFWVSSGGEKTLEAILLGLLDAAASSS